MIELVTGRPGHGKSYYLANKTYDLVRRSAWIEKKYKKERLVYTNFHLHLPKKYQKYHRYYNSPVELIDKRDIDVLIDEIGYFFPSDQWKNTDEEIRRMFAQHRKRGMEMYANTQAYMNVDINVRRMLERVKEIRKLVGSRNPSATKPDVKRIWGFFMIRKIDVTVLEEENKYKYQHIIPEIVYMRRKIVKMFDTTEDIKLKEVPKRLTRHVVNQCLHCNYKRISHS